MVEEKIVIKFEEKMYLCGKIIHVEPKSPEEMLIRKIMRSVNNSIEKAESYARKGYCYNTDAYLSSAKVEAEILGIDIKVRVQNIENILKEAKIHFEKECIEAKIQRFMEDVFNKYNNSFF
ncbi:MAG: hypothetical protein PHT91_00760 [Candidatus Nanoarchaeia archaeon]|nr:hypothetical protein [Candidatus Nanoarchaeia archaeon]